MKRKTLVIAAAALVALAGMTIGQMNSNQQGPSGSGRGPGGARLTEAEVTNILLMREEEKLARDVYLEMYELWGAEIFANIAESEQRHMDAVKQLISRYDLTDPVVSDAVGTFTNPVFAQHFEELVQSGSVSLEEAVKVGVFIEELDIADLERALAETSSRAVVRVFENLLAGSRRHLEAFKSCLESGGTCGTGPGSGACAACSQANTARQGNGASQGNGRQGR